MSLTDQTFCSRSIPHYALYRVDKSWLRVFSFYDIMPTLIIPVIPYIVNAPRIRLCSVHEEESDPCSNERLQLGLPDLPYFTGAPVFQAVSPRLPFKTNTGYTFSRILTSLNYVA